MLEHETLSQQASGIVLHLAQHLLHGLRLFGVAANGRIRRGPAGVRLALAAQQVGQTRGLGRSLRGRRLLRLGSGRQGLPGILFA